MSAQDQEGQLIDGVTPPKKVKKEIRRPLKPRDIRFLKAKVANPDIANYKAAMIATGNTTVASANVTAQRMLQNATLREAIDKEMYDQGIAMSHVISPVEEALNYQDETDVRGALDMRLKGHDRAMKLLAIVSGEELRQGANNTFNFNFGSTKYIANKPPENPQQG